LKQISCIQLLIKVGKVIQSRAIKFFDMALTHIPQPFNILQSFKTLFKSCVLKERIDS